MVIVNICCIFVRLSKEIIEEVRTTYEMPPEAVNWISDMIAYTVAGGKMNRGLSCVSVMRTLSDDQGKEFTARVSCWVHLLHSSVIFFAFFALIRTV